MRVVPFPILSPSLFHLCPFFVIHPTLSLPSSSFPLTFRTLCTLPLSPPYPFFSLTSSNSTPIMSMFLPCAPHYLPRVSRDPLHGDLPALVSSQSRMNSLDHGAPPSRPSPPPGPARLYPFGRRASAHIPVQQLLDFFPRMMQTRVRGGVVVPSEGHESEELLGDWSSSEMTLSDEPLQTPVPIPGGRRRRSGWDIQALAGVGFITLSPSS